ncbi:hypothetical protein ACLMJK_007480 [Lecanora helva]
MEGLAAAGGVIAVISLAGQVLSGLRFLDQFFGDISDAPDFILRLQQEIDILKAVLQAVAEYENTFSANEEQAIISLAPSIRLCHFWVAKLERAMDKYTLMSSHSQVRRHWSSILHALQMPKVEKYVARLGQARMMLIQAQIAMEGPRQIQLRHNLTRALEDQARNTNLIGSIDRKLAALSLEQSASTSITREQQADIGASLSNLAAEHSASTNIIQRINRNLDSSSQTSRRHIDTNNVTEKLLSSGRFSGEVASQLMPTLAPLISKAVQEGFQKAVNQQDVSIEMQNLNDDHSSPDLASEIQSNRQTHSLEDLGRISANPSHYLSGVSESPPCWRRNRIVIPGGSKEYNTLIGKLRCQTSTVVHEERDIMSDDLVSQDNILVCRIAYIPPDWLCKWVSPPRLKWVDQEIKNPSFKLRIEPLRIVPTDSAVFKACAHGDIRVIRRLFSAQQASIYDRNHDGDTLLDVALELDCFGDTFDFHQYRRKLDTAYWLIEQGIDSGASNFGYAGSSLGRYMQSFANFYDETHNFDLESELISYMIKKAKTDPFQGTSDYLFPSKWNWEASPRINGDGAHKRWGPNGVWSFLLPPILRQDIWPFECNYDKDVNLLDVAIRSGISQFRDIEPIEISPLKTWRRYVSESVRTFGQNQNPFYYDEEAPFRLDESILLYYEEGLVVNERQKILLRRAVDDLLLTRIPLLKLLLAKWSAYYLTVGNTKQSHLLGLVGEEIRKWVAFLDHYGDVGKFDEMSKAAFELVEFIIQHCGDSKGLTVFGSPAQTLFGAVGSRRKGWPPRSRLTTDLVDVLNEGRIPAKMGSILRHSSEAEIARDLKERYVFPRKNPQSNKLPREIPQFASIAYFDLPRSSDKEVPFPICIFLSEDVHPAIKDVHDEIAETALGIAKICL